jgi:hypothetical protein
MPGCSAVGFLNRRETGFRMFRFPREESRRAIWIAKVQRDRWQPSDTAYLCQVSFQEPVYRIYAFDRLLVCYYSNCLHI